MAQAFLRPDADAVDGNWLNQSGSATDLYSVLDETSADDADYIQSPVSPVAEVCRIALGNPTGPASQPFTVSYRFNNLNGASLTVRLKQGTTTIASWDETGSGWTTSDRTLTSPQFAAITDFTDLFVEFEANGATDLSLKLDLDFTAMPYGIDSRVTFSRSSAATFVNSAGLIQAVTTNLLSRSADMNNYSTTTVDPTKWTRGGSSVTIGAAVVGPDGSMTGRTINVGTDTGDSAFFQHFAGIVTPGATYTLSVWAKKSASGSANKFRMTTNSAYAWNTGISQKFTLTDSWARYTMTGVISTGTSANVGISDRRQVDGSYDSDSDLTGNVDFWGPQLELGAAAGVYFPTNSGANTNYGPRFEHELISGTPRGLLIEEQRTNRCLQSAFASGYTAYAGTATPNAVVAPDGTTTGLRFTATDTSSSARQVQVPGSMVIGGETFAASVYIKPNGVGMNAYIQVNTTSGAFPVYFDLAALTATVGDYLTGSGFPLRTGTIIDVGGGWRRCTCLFTHPGGASAFLMFVGPCKTFDGAGDDRVYTGVVGEGIDMWGAQAELCASGSAAFASSYIPTTGSEVTRAADQAEISYSSWYTSDTYGTYVVEGQGARAQGNPADPTFILSGENSGYGTLPHLLYRGSDPSIFAYTSMTYVTVTQTLPGFSFDTDPYKLAIAWVERHDAGGIHQSRIVGNGVLPAAANYTQWLYTKLHLGKHPGGVYYINGTIKRLRYFDVMKTDEQLQELTGPALDLDFAKMGTLDRRITLTRASAATYVDRSGVVRLSAVDQPRLNERGLLIEHGRANLLLHSGDLSVSPWGGYVDGSGSSSCTANSGTAPDGTNTATLCTVNRTAAAEWAQGATQEFTGTAAVYVGSVWLKAYAVGDVGKIITIGLWNSITVVSILNVTLTANWVRYEVNGTLAGATCQLVTGYFSTTGTPAGVGTTTGETKYLAWGAQAELGSAASSYIPTTTATVTRAGDSAAFNNIGWFTQATGTVVQEVEQIEATNYANPCWFYAFGSSPNTGFNFDSHAFFGWVMASWAGAVAGDGEAHIGNYAANVPFKSAMAWTANDVAAVQDGGTVLTGGAGFVPPTNITQIWLGHNWFGYAMHGYFRRLRFYNTRKSNAEIQALTT